MQRQQWALVITGTLLTAALLWGLAESNLNRFVGRPARAIEERDAAARFVDEAPESESKAPLGAEAQWLTELPPEYFGDIAISGIVKQVGGTPVAGAMVLCLPRDFRPFAGIQWKRWRATTNDSGHFEFKDLPEATNYEIRAHARIGAGQTELLKRHATSAPVTIWLRPVSYERIGFFEPDGRPVDVSAYRLSMAHRRLLFGSDTNMDRQMIENWFHADAARVDWKPSEALFIYPSEAAAEDEGARTLELPGYEPVSVPRRRRPWADWPQSTGRVVLKPLPRTEQRLYRVLMPEEEFPKEWGARGAYARYALIAVVGTGLRPKTWGLNSTFSVFPIQPRQPLRLLYQMEIEVPFDLKEGNDETIVVPRVEGLGYLTVQYAPERRDHPDARVIPLLYAREGVKLPSRIVWPGLARIGPVPIGNYTLALLWSDDPSPSLRSMETRGVRVAKGWQGIDLR